MTREEAIEILEKEKVYMLGHGGDRQAEALNMAIKALSQPCTDAVSRESVIQSIKEHAYPIVHGVNNHDMGMTVDGIKQAVMEVSSVQPTQKWIPVSEKLPKRRDWYLGVFKEPDTGWVNPLPYVCDYVGKETRATTKDFWILRGITDADHCSDYYRNLECVAWCELPAPYEQKEEE